MVCTDNSGVYREIKQQDNCEELKICSWNVNELIRKITDEQFHNYISSLDIVLLTEIWINEKHQINLDINNYKSFHLHGNKLPRTKKGRTSGGISVYYKNNLEHYISVVETNNIGFFG